MSMQMWTISQHKCGLLASTMAHNRLGGAAGRGWGLWARAESWARAEAALEAELTGRLAEAEGRLAAAECARSGRNHRWPATCGAHSEALVSDSPAVSSFLHGQRALILIGAPCESPRGKRACSQGGGGSGDGKARGGGGGGGRVGGCTGGVPGAVDPDLREEQRGDPMGGRTVRPHGGGRLSSPCTSCCCSLLTAARSWTTQ